MKYEYKEKEIVFYKNVAPMGFKPLWEVDYVAKKYGDIKNIESFSEDEGISMLWFFEDIIKHIYGVSNEN